MRHRRGNGHVPVWLIAAFLLMVVPCVLRSCGTASLRSHDGDMVASDDGSVSAGADGTDGREDRGGADGDERPNDLATTTSLRDAAGSHDGVSVFTEEGTVEQVACHLLTSYRDEGDCALAHADYLDLLGKVWCCVVVGDGWSEVCTVWGSADDANCKVSVLHLDGQEVGRLFEEEDEDGG